MCSEHLAHLHNCLCTRYDFAFKLQEPSVVDHDISQSDSYRIVTKGLAQKIQFIVITTGRLAKTFDIT